MGDAELDRVAALRLRLLKERVRQAQQPAASPQALPGAGWQPGMPPYTPFPYSPGVLPPISQRPQHGDLASARRRQAREAADYQMQEATTMLTSTLQAMVDRMNEEAEIEQRAEEERLKREMAAREKPKDNTLDMMTKQSLLLQSVMMQQFMAQQKAPPPPPPAPVDNTAQLQLMIEAMRYNNATRDGGRGGGGGGIDPIMLQSVQQMQTMQAQMAAQQAAQDARIQQLIDLQTRNVQGGGSVAMDDGGGMRRATPLPNIGAGGGGGGGGGGNGGGGAAAAAVGPATQLTTDDLHIVDPVQVPDEEFPGKQTFEEWLQMKQQINGEEAEEALKASVGASVQKVAFAVWFVTYLRAFTRLRQEARKQQQKTLKRNIVSQVTPLVNWAKTTCAPCLDKLARVEFGLMVENEDPEALNNVRKLQELTTDLINCLTSADSVKALPPAILSICNSLTMERAVFPSQYLLPVEQDYLEFDKVGRATFMTTQRRRLIAGNYLLLRALLMEILLNELGVWTIATTELLSELAMARATKQKKGFFKKKKQEEVAVDPHPPYVLQNFKAVGTIFYNIMLAAVADAGEPRVDPEEDTAALTFPTADMLFFYSRVDPVVQEEWERQLRTWLDHLLTVASLPEGAGRNSAMMGRIGGSRASLQSRARSATPQRRSQMGSRQSDAAASRSGRSGR